MDYEIIIRFLLAGLWGGIVGAEREYRSKSAGFRTLIMISIGACFFTMMSELLGGENPDRIAANIVTGIGFLGAGVIFRGEGRINGITTAATIWAVAAVGMGIGAGNYFASAAASLLILFVLAILPMFERIIERMHQSKTYVIECDCSADKRAHFTSLFREHNLKSKLIREAWDSNVLSMTWMAEGGQKSHEKFISALYSDSMVKTVEYS